MVPVVVVVRTETFLEEAARPLKGDLAGRIAAAGQPHVILISLDTLRADHLGSYGYGKETSPFLDELASFGVRFEQVISQSPKTAPSHMSLFTGVYPYAHGTHFLYEEHEEAGVVPVSPELKMLPEWFREMGGGMAVRDLERPPTPGGADGQKFQTKLTRGNTKNPSELSGATSPRSAERRSPMKRGPIESNPSPLGNR